MPLQQQYKKQLLNFLDKQQHRYTKLAFQYSKKKYIKASLDILDPIPKVLST